MISLQYSNFILACKNKAEERNDLFAEQGVIYAVTYPYKRREEDVINLRISVTNPKTKRTRHSNCTMSEKEFNENLKTGRELQDIVNLLFDLCTNKARGDVML